MTGVQKNGPSKSGPNDTRIKIDFNDCQWVRQNIANEIESIIQEAGYATEAAAKRKAPVDTGYLRNSITTTFPTPTRAIIDASADYAAHVEFGTIHSKAQPFMRFAVRAVRPVIRRRMMALGAKIKKK